MEVKYGRSFKLSNGEREYIELSDNIELPYQRDRKISYLKSEVGKYHSETEDMIKAWSEEPTQECGSDSNKSKDTDIVWGILFIVIYSIVCSAIEYFFPIWVSFSFIVISLICLICYKKRSNK